MCPSKKIGYALSSRLPYHPQFKILRSIVQFLPVLMVNVLAFSESSAQHLFHHSSVLKHVVTVDTQTTVPIAVDPPSCDVSGGGFSGVAVDTQPEVMHVAQLSRLHTTTALGNGTDVHTSSVLVWRVAYHTSFGHTHTDETDDVIKFRHDIGPVDWFEVYGAYITGGMYD
jgi:hypothetical protein